MAKLQQELEDELVRYRDRVLVISGAGVSIGATERNVLSHRGSAFSAMGSNTARRTVMGLRAPAYRPAAMPKAWPSGGR
jgi:hypothetical protein